MSSLKRLLTKIYIPVWFDLKDHSNVFGAIDSLIYIPVWFDLKADKNVPLTLLYLIYIPVWFDLKVKVANIGRLVSKIYIPVWFDLKQDSCYTRAKSNSNLHSSMVRFKARLIN